MKMAPFLRRLRIILISVVIVGVAGCDSKPAPISKTRIELLREKATAQDPEACYALAEVILAGHDYQLQGRFFPIILYSIAANRGVPDAQFRVGYFYEHGDYLPKNLVEMERWYRRAAKNGSVDAQYHLGLLYEAGTGVPQNYTEAADWYRRAAIHGNLDAQFNLGVLYERGLGVPKDEVEASRWYAKLAEVGDIGTYGFDSTSLFPASQSRGPLSQIFGLIERLASNGNSIAAWLMRLKFVDNLHKHNGQAISFTVERAAADRGNVIAQGNIGVALALGSGLPGNESEAILYFCKAAKQGDVRSAYNLGFMYANGFGVEKDEGQALEWYKDAASHGYYQAIIKVGEMLELGQGTNRDETSAFRWYQKMVNETADEIQFRLGVKYANGRGVTQDKAEAYRWYRKAAKQGNPSGAFIIENMPPDESLPNTDDLDTGNRFHLDSYGFRATVKLLLGIKYQIGLGVPKDLVRAYSCFNDLAAAGVTVARQRRDALERLMTPEQVAEAQRLSERNKTGDRGPL